MNDNAVRASIIHLLRSNAFDILEEPTAIGIDDMLFKTPTQILSSQIDSKIRYILDKYEKRIEVIEVIDDFSVPSHLTIEIKYRIIDLDVVDSIKYTIKRTN